GSEVASLGAQATIPDAVANLRRSRRETRCGIRYLRGAGPACAEHSPDHGGGSSRPGFVGEFPTGVRWGDIAVAGCPIFVRISDTPDNPADSRTRYAVTSRDQAGVRWP